MQQTEAKNRRKIREQVKSLALFDIILQNIDNGISVYNPEGPIVYENGIAEVIRKKYFRKSVRIADENGMLIPQEELPASQALRDRRTHSKKVEVIRTSKQPPLWYRIRSVPVFDKKNRLVYVLDSWRDITDSVLEKRRRDHFIAIGSHELRTPLAGIKVLNQVMQKLYLKKKHEKVKTFFSKIDEKVNTLTAIIHDFIEVEKIRGGKLEFNPETFDFDKFVASTIQDLDMTYKSHKIQVSGETHISIIADKVRLQEVLINLIGNARKYSPQADTIDVRLISGEKTVTVAIQDYGYGMDKKYQSQIFQPFYRVRDSRIEKVNGLGLGLYISYKIVELHGGTMWVKSKLDQGSTFYISLPRVIKKTKKVYDF